MVTSLDYAGVYERVRGDSAWSPPETAYCTLVSEHKPKC